MTKRLSDTSLNNLASWRRRRKPRPVRSPESNAVARSRILSLLCIAPGLLSSEIAEALNMGWSTTSHALRSLESLQLVCRLSKTPNDSMRAIRWCLATHWYMFEKEAPTSPPRQRATNRRVLTSDDLVQGIDGDGGITTNDVRDSLSEDER